MLARAMLGNLEQGRFREGGKHLVGWKQWKLCLIYVENLK
jgi:hypothetical protein